MSKAGDTAKAESEGASASQTSTLTSLKSTISSQLLSSNMSKAGATPKTESEWASASQIRTLTSLQSTISSLELINSLRRKRDLMSLLCSYPLDMRVIFDDFISKPYCESKLPLKLEGLLPKAIIRDAENGDMSGSNFIFGDANLDFIPEAILDMAADLAVHQLMQTLISICKSKNPKHAKCIRLSTRSDVEKRTVMEKVTAALNDKHHSLDILNSFHGHLTIDATGYPTSEAEKELKQHICQLLQLSTIKYDDILCTLQIEDEMSRSRYLVILVDRDGEEIVDPQKVGLYGTLLTGVLVIITTDSPSSQQAKEGGLKDGLVNLEIRTKEHLLPWVVFCDTAGKEFVYSSDAILTTAVRIVEECRSHLHAILLVAKWLKNHQDVRMWELALHKLQFTNPSHDVINFHGLNSIMINTFLNLTWDGMNKTQQNCLLSCSGIPKIRDGMVDHELMNHWMSSLFVDAGETEKNLRQLVENSIFLQFDGVGGRFIVGRHMQRIISSIPPATDVEFKQSNRSLKFVKGEGVTDEIKMLLRHSKALFLDRHFTLKSLTEFEMKNLEQLRVCILAECKEMQTIVGGGDLDDNIDMLPHLLFLSIFQMKNLRSIWEGSTPPPCLFGMCCSLCHCKVVPS
nr:uncharacterized protein LOC112714960 isoform X2 [Arachis hypogaea]